MTTPRTIHLSAGRFCRTDASMWNTACGRLRVSFIGVTDAVTAVTCPRCAAIALIASTTVATT